MQSSVTLPPFSSLRMTNRLRRVRVAAWISRWCCQQYSLHFHAINPRPKTFIGSFAFTFVFINISLHFLSFMSIVPRVKIHAFCVFCVTAATVALHLPRYIVLRYQSWKTLSTIISINARFVGRRYTTRPGAPAIVGCKHDQKVHSWVVSGMYSYQ